MGDFGLILRLDVLRDYVEAIFEAVNLVNDFGDGVGACLSIVVVVFVGEEKTQGLGLCTELIPTQLDIQVTLRLQFHRVLSLIPLHKNHISILLCLKKQL